MSENSYPDWPHIARVALYYVPARRSDWWAAGCSWLGRDAESGGRLLSPHPPGLNAPLENLTAGPRRYGWHATLVPPFRLGDGVGVGDVLARTADWARSQEAAGLAVEAETLGDIVALRPAEAEGAMRMRNLASSALIALASLRAPLSPGEIARRARANLSERQRALLSQWHYPYVFDEFRFHMTLSDPLEDEGERDILIRWWRTQIERLGPLSVDGVAIFVEPAPDEPFVLWRRLALGAGTRAV